MEPVELHGTAFEMGEQHGRRLARLISQVVVQELPAGWDGIPSLQEQIGSTEKNLAKRFPETLEEMAGIAAGAKLSYNQILLLNLSYEFESGVSQTSTNCTAIGLPGVTTGPFVAKTDDVYLSERSFEIFFRARPQHGCESMYYAFGGTLWNHGGINRAGLAVAMTGLPAFGPPNLAGIPSLIFLRLLLFYCETVDQALVFCKANPLLRFGCTLTMADRCSSDIIVVENLPATRHTYRSPGEPTVRTNHSLAPDIQVHESSSSAPNHFQFPDIRRNSQQRLEQASRLVHEIPYTVLGLQQLMANHARVGAICQHGEAGLHTSIAMILDPKRLEIIASEGYGCGSYITYTF